MPGAAASGMQHAISSTACASVIVLSASTGWSSPPGRPEVCENIWRSVIPPFAPVKAGSVAETGASRSSVPASTSVIRVAAESSFVAEAIGTTVCAEYVPK